MRRDSVTFDMPRPDVACDVRVLTNIDELEALRFEWQDVWERSAAPSIFQSPAWLIPWARIWAAEALRVVTVRHDDRLVGIAPLFRHDRGDPSERCVLLIGSGISDTLDLIAESGAEHVLASLLHAELAQWNDWDLLEWQQLRSTSALLTEPALDTWSSDIEHSAPLPVVELQPDVPVASRLSPHFARRLQADRRRLERLGDVRFETATEQTLGTSLDLLEQLHRARWTARGKTGVLCDLHVARFHREAAAALLAMGVLRLELMFVGERAAAVYYGFQHRDRASYYLGGFEPALARFGVGNQMVWHAMERARREGARCFDFLCGGESYKYRWGATNQPAYRRRIRRPDTQKPR